MRRPSSFFILWAVRESRAARLRQRTVPCFPTTLLDSRQDYKIFLFWHIRIVELLKLMMA